MKLEYVGKELDLFKEAKNWKQYFARHIAGYIKGNVLEVGAGLGGTTSFLINDSVETWTCLEPDEELYEQLVETIKKENLSNCIARKGTLESLNKEERFDTIIYIDVIEHIEKDVEEMQMASKHLNAGGHIIILSPAFQFLFSPFDKAIGHFRRYRKKDLTRFSSDHLIAVKTKYLDSFGWLASSANKLFLKQSYPTKKQVLFWDRVLLKFSRIFDPFFFYSFGKSILGIWRKK